MQRLEVSGAVRLIYRSLGVKGLKIFFLFSKTSELALLSIKPSISRAKIKRPGRDADYYHLMFRLRMTRAINTLPHISLCGPGSSVGVATGYRLDGSGIESLWGRDFFTPVQTGPGAHPASCTMGTGSFPGVKSGRGVTLIHHPLWAVRPLQSLNACTREHFTLLISRCGVHRNKLTLPTETRRSVFVVHLCMYLSHISRLVSCRRYCNIAITLSPCSVSERSVTCSREISFSCKLLPILFAV